MPFEGDFITLCPFPFVASPLTGAISFFLHLVCRGSWLSQAPGAMALHRCFAVAVSDYTVLMRIWLRLGELMKM